MSDLVSEACNEYSSCGQLDCWLDGSAVREKGDANGIRNGNQVGLPQVQSPTV